MDNILHVKLQDIKDRNCLENSKKLTEDQKNDICVATEKTIVSLFNHLNGLDICDGCAAHMMSFFIMNQLKKCSVKKTTTENIVKNAVNLAYDDEEPGRRVN